MQPLEVYKEFLLRINKNDTNKQINIPKGEFVLLFNSEALNWLSNSISDKESSDEAEDINELLEQDVELTKVIDKALHSEFQLPSDFFSRTNVYCVASKYPCKDVILYAFPFKAKNKNVLLLNVNEQPSFEYQETLFSLSNNKLLLYKTDFTIDKAFLSYYREPVKLDIEGYIKLDGTASINQPTDLNDFNTGLLLDKCAEVVLGRYQNVEGSQLAAQATAQNKK